MFSSYRTTNPQLNEEASLGILQHLNKDELQQLLDDDSHLMDLIKDDSQIKQFQSDKESLLARNRSVAEYNLSLEPRLNSTKQQLASTHEQSVNVQKEYEETKQKLDYKLSQQNLDTVLALLQTEAAKSEEQSEDMSSRFLEVGSSEKAESFLDDYMAQRTVAHIRKVKVEKMQELIRGGCPKPTPAASYVPPATGPAPPTQSAAPYPPIASWGAPYPSHNTAMPNPTSYLHS